VTAGLIDVCADDAVAPGKAMPATVTGPDGGDLEVAIARDSAGQWHALGGVCSHEYVLLGEGDVTPEGLECWGHGSCFNLETGVPNELPAITPVPVYEVHHVAGRILIDPHPKETIR
jgi:3-phenylpropionate/trans-cinnamate dioxygenase ferredoxin subunit